MSLVARRVIYQSISQLPEMFFSKGSVNVLKNITSENLLVLVSKSVSASEFYSKTKEKAFSNKTIKEEIFSNASQQSILDLVNKYKNWPPDAVVAIGGGVVLDSAKLVRHFLSFPEDSFSALAKQFVSPTPSVKLISVPTTPNTGSESNTIAVTFDTENKKQPFINKSFLPNLAILEPNFLSSIPPTLMYDFIADIITHAYEGSISRLSNPYLQSLAQYSMQELENGLRIYDQSADDLKGVELIQLAGHQAGIVAGNAFVGMIHALGHSLETMKKVSHGFALHSIFKQCVEWQVENNPDKKDEAKNYLELWKRINLQESTDLKFTKKIDPGFWSELAVKDPSIKTDPIKFSSEKILEVISWIQNNY